MSLIRKALRTELVAALLHETAAEGRVYGNRATMPRGLSLPAIVVHTRRDPAELHSQSPRSYLRELEVYVELFVRAKEGEIHDDLLDVLDAQAFVAIHRQLDRIGDEYSLHWTLTGFRGTECDFTADGARIVGGARQTWVLAYEERVPNDPGELEQLKLAHVEWETLPLDGELEATDDIVVPES